ncbi:MAG: HAD family hydrolase [Actinomycetota bacterium]
MLQALLFDVDGTLADTERDGHRLAFNAAFRELGFDWEWDAELYGELLAVTGGKERTRFHAERLGLSVPDELVVALHAAKTRHYTRMLAEGGIPLRPGVRRLLEEARAAGLGLAIATTTTPENVTALLRHSLAPDGPEWFEVIAAGDVVPAKKPAPDIYRWALERLGLGPEKCLALEDSHNGLQAALGAGFPTIITVNGYTLHDDFSGALAVLSDLGEPGAPYRRLDREGSGVVDIATLRAWHAS